MVTEIMFVGGPRHGQTVPDWANQLESFNLIAGDEDTSVDGSIKTERFKRHRYAYPDGSETAFYASIGLMPAEVEASAFKLLTRQP